MVKISKFPFSQQSMENEKKNTKLTLNEPYRLCFWYSNRISLSSDLFDLFVANMNLWVTASAINVDFLYSLCVYSLKMRHWSPLVAIGRNCSYWAVTNYISRMTTINDRMTMNGHMTINDRMTKNNRIKSKSTEVRKIASSLR